MLFSWEHHPNYAIFAKLYGIKMKNLLLLLMLLGAMLLCVAATAQNYKTYVSPAYFGPNTFQVPQMNSGARMEKNIVATLCGDFIWGHTGKKDYTGDVYVELHLPLFTDRVNLSSWGALHEWYDQSADVLEYRKVGATGAKTEAAGAAGTGAGSGTGTGAGTGATGTATGAARGHQSGPLFISTDITVLKEKKFCPSMLIRAGLRTASENDAFPIRRGYDSAGYFFDLALGKSFGPVSIAASTGFLCWQTGDGEQNDAVMFGGKISYNHEFVRAGLQYGGYWGWRKDGVFPRVMYLDMDFGPRKWYVKPYLLYQHGFHDWPFDLFRAGIKIDIDIFGLVAAHKKEKK